MKFKIFVDGQEGTTGLKINERLAGRKDLEILTIEPGKRKDPEARRILLNEADIAFLCLPDEASRESVSLVNNDRTKIIDASTAFRTDPNWTYGLPELNEKQREKIRKSHRVSVPGCHATGYNLIIYPLVNEGIMPKDYPVNCYTVAGYSGGGKKMISEYETIDKKPALKIPRFYSLKLNHKHIPEMQKVSGLIFPPIFTPIVGDFYNGEVVSIPLFPRLLNKQITAKDTHKFLDSYYKSERFVKVMPFDIETNLDNGFLGATECNNSNKLEIFVFGSDEHILITSRFDNLGKGSSGAAIQNMNIMLDVDEGLGLEEKLIPGI